MLNIWKFAGKIYKGVVWPCKKAAYGFKEMDFMRRKGFAIAAAAAVLTFGMMINAYAAEGWARSESNT